MFTKAVLGWVFNSLYVGKICWNSDNEIEFEQVFFRSGPTENTYTKNQFTMTQGQDISLFSRGLVNTKYYYCTLYKLM